MLRTIWMALFVLFSSTACLEISDVESELVCHPASVALHPEQPLVGQWEGLTDHRRLVYVFGERGSFRLLQITGVGDAAQVLERGAWALEGELLTLSRGGYERTERIAIEGNRLLFLIDEGAPVFQHVHCTRLDSASATDPGGG